MAALDLFLTGHSIVLVMFPVVAQHNPLVYSTATDPNIHLSQCAQVGDWKTAKYIYEFGAKDIDGEDVALEKYR